jgi:hypothetical protein
MLRKFLLVLFALSLSAGAALAQNCSAYPYTLSNGTNADASQVMANLNQILNCVNNFSLGVSTGGTGQTSLNNHSLLIGQGTNPVANTGTGTTGQCVVSQGASANPTFISGCLVLLATYTPASVASVCDTTHITSTYNDYELVFENFLPATNTVGCQVQVHSNGAFQTTTYVAGAYGHNNGTAFADTSTTNIPCGHLTTGTGNIGPGLACTYRLYNANLTVAPKNWTGICTGTNPAGNILSFSVGGFWNGGNTAIDGFQVQFTSGNITSGTVKLYGLL